MEDDGALKDRQPAETEADREQLIKESVMRILGDQAIPGEAPNPYNWENEVAPVDEERRQRAEKAADPLNPDYLIKVLDTSGYPTLDAPSSIGLSGEKRSMSEIYRIKPKKLTVCSNNGMTAYVAEDGSIFVTRSSEELSDSLRELGYESGSMFVPFSNGDRPSSLLGNEKLNAAEMVNEAKKKGILIESREDLVLDSAAEYTPDIDLPRDVVEDVRVTLEEMQEALEKLEAMPESINGKAYLEGKITETEKRLAEYQKLLEVGALFSDDQFVQTWHDQGRYTVVQGENELTIRFVDCYGRYMQAPYSEDQLAVLENKGYKPKIEVVRDGHVTSGGSVLGPRSNGPRPRNPYVPPERVQESL